MCHVPAMKRINALRFDLRYIYPLYSTITSKWRIIGSKGQLLCNTNFPVINSIYVEPGKKNPFRHHRSAIVILDVLPDPGSQISPGLAV